MHKETVRPSFETAERPDPTEEEESPSTSGEETAEVPSGGIAEATSGSEASPNLDQGGSEVYTMMTSDPRCH